MRAIIFALFSLFLVITFTTTPTYAQKKKVDEALDQFLDTKFMKKYIEMRDEAERTVMEFKQKADLYNPADVKTVEQGYARTQREFDKVLYEIKKDLTDPKKRKFVEKFPEMYGNNMEVQLDNLNDFYAENFQQPLRDVTGDEIDGNPLLLLITELIGATSELVGKYLSLKVQSKQFTDGYLQENFVDPYEFKDWNEIGTDTNNGGFDQNGTDQYNQNQGGYDNTGGYDQNGGSDYNNTNDNSNTNTNDTDWDW
ncbi:MAG: hypothetical protein R3E32_23250 [Chitinophagales bacterium]